MILTASQLTDAQVLALFCPNTSSPTSSADTIGSVAATGVSQSTAAALANTINIVLSGSGAGVVLQASITKATVRNRTGGLISVWPPTGEQIDGTSGINQPTTIASGDDAIFVRLAGTPVTWFC